MARTPRILSILAALCLALGPGVLPALADSDNQVCTERHQDVVEICLRNHDPIIRGMCMEMAAQQLKNCLQGSKDKK